MTGPDPADLRYLIEPIDFESVLITEAWTGREGYYAVRRGSRYGSHLGKLIFLDGQDVRPDDGEVELRLSRGAVLAAYMGGIRENMVYDCPADL